jgi:hypothetical protein
MARTRHPTARWTGVTLLHLAFIGSVGYGAHQVLPAAMGAVWRWVFVVGITLCVSLAADPLLGRLYGAPELVPAGGGPAALLPASTNTDDCTALPQPTS